MRRVALFEAEDPSGEPLEKQKLDPLNDTLPAVSRTSPQAGLLVASSDETHSGQSSGATECVPEVGETVVDAAPPSRQSTELLTGVGLAHRASA